MSDDVVVTPKSLDLETLSELASVATDIIGYVTGTKEFNKEEAIVRVYKLTGFVLEKFFGFNVKSDGKKPAVIKEHTMQCCYDCKAPDTHQLVVALSAFTKSEDTFTTKAVPSWLIVALFDLAKNWLLNK